MEGWWPLRFLQRVAYVATLAMAPLQVATLMIEITLGLGVVMAVALAVAVSTHSIPDSVTAGLLTQIGKRVNEILHAQGIY